MKIENIEDLLKGIYKGDIVLPDFQRSFVWKPEDVRELLVSIVSGFFIGSMLMMDSISEESDFALRLIEGVENVNPDAKVQSLVKIILDGQQRATALFYAVYQPDIPLKDRKSPFLFYLDLNKAFNDEWEDCVISVSKNSRKALSELKKREEKKEIISFSKLWEVEDWIDEIDNKEKRKKGKNYVNYLITLEIINYI